MSEDSRPGAALNERITLAAKALREAERPLRILGLLAWPLEVRERFLAANGREMPRISYPDPDTGGVREALESARRLIPDCGPAREWLTRTAARIENATDMLYHLGTRDFHQAACRLYGSPSGALPDSEATPLELARRLRQIIDQLNHLDLGAPPEASVTAEAVARRMGAAARQFFGSEAPAIELVENLSANATAGPDRIRIRSTAHFTERDVEQLIHHEAGIHVGTGLNGRHQPHLPILASSHPGTTRTQEGLAVFSEFITGTMDLDRLGRLADRVLAIQMAVDGADFLQVYRYFLERGSTEKIAYEQARRVFRGGPLEGGAPFTKDLVYLDGLLRVHEFLRQTVAAGRADCLQLLFCGKLDLEDIPVLADLAGMGLLQPPRYLPAWARDRRFLVAYLAYSGFLGQVRFDGPGRHYAELLQRIPEVRFSPPGP